MDHPRNILNKEEFLRVLNFCRQNYKFAGEKNDLDIRSQYVKLDKSGLSNIRCSISCSRTSRNIVKQILL